MSINVSFELADEDIAYFHQAMLAAQDRADDLSKAELLERSQTLLEQAAAQRHPEFVVQRLCLLRTLIAMYCDQAWPLSADAQQSVIAALAYFTQADDLIPDATPALGFVDDAIAIELICRDLGDEIDAYRDFLVYRDAEQRYRQPGDVISKADWLQAQRHEMHARVRNRRVSRQLLRQRQSRVRSGFGVY